MAFLFIDARHSFEASHYAEFQRRRKAKANKSDSVLFFARNGLGCAPRAGCPQSEGLKFVVIYSVTKAVYIDRIKINAVMCLAHTLTKLILMSFTNGKYATD